MGVKRRAGLCGVVRRRGRAGLLGRVVSQPRISGPWRRGRRFSLIVMLRRVAGSLVLPFPLAVLVLFPGRLVVVARYCVG